jgi:steroid Delta-isomerase
MPSLPPSAALTQLVAAYENLTPQTLDALVALYAPQARFKDPFNDTVGPAAIREVFEHMFRSVHEPRFVVTGHVLQGPQAFLIWDFHFRFQRGDTQTLQTVRGATHLVWDADGRVQLHRDYWDVAEDLYEKLPGLGTLMRWLKRRARR